MIVSKGSRSFSLSRYFLKGILVGDLADGRVPELELMLVGGLREEFERLR